MSFVLPKCATSSVRSVPCELARTSAFRSMGRYSTAKAASANRIKNKAVRGKVPPDKKTSRGKRETV